MLKKSYKVYLHFERNIKKGLLLLLTGMVLYACTPNKEKGNTISQKSTPQRYAMITGLNPEKEAYYRKLHANAWKDVLKKIKECNIRNYSIYIKQIEGKPYLFSYFEYTGGNFEQDMKKMAADSTTRRWWQETDPCQAPLPEAKAKGAIWSPMEEVFHTE